MSSAEWKLLLDSTWSKVAQAFYSTTASFLKVETGQKYLMISSCEIEITGQPGLHFEKHPLQHVHRVKNK